MVDPLNQEPGFVYAIQSLDLIKVGVAKNIENRMEAMRLMNPHGCKLIFRRRSASPYTLERQMHRLLAEHAIGREWFRATIADVRAAAYAAKLETARIETMYRQKFIAAVAKRERLAQCVKIDGAVSKDINELIHPCGIQREECGAEQQIEKPQ